MFPQKFPTFLFFFLFFLPVSFVHAFDAGDDLHALFQDEWENRLQEEPLTASYAGVKKYNDRLPSVTPEDQQRRLEQDQKFLARLEKIDRAALSEEDRLNYDLFKFVLENRIEQAHYKTWRIPFLSDYGFYTAVTSMKSAVPFRTVGDYEDYISRLEDVPRFFDEHIENMETGINEDFTMPRVILDRVIPVFEAQLVEAPSKSGLYDPFKNMPDTISTEEQERLKAEALETIEEEALAAFEGLLEFFREDYRPAARETLGATELPGGEDYYAWLVRYYTTLDLTPSEIHDIGLEEVERIRSEMREIIERTGFDGSFDEFLEFLRTDPRFYAETPRELLAEASYHAKRIDGQMPAFFGKLPRLPYGVKAVPDDIAPGYTTGRYWGGSLENGIAGFYMVNTYALDKRPLYALPSLTLHEGVPGHHHQIALTQEQENVPEFRKNMYLSAFGEGWGLYSEKLGIEMGIYENDYQDFGRLTYEMWRAGRLVVDTGLHAMGWTREEAIQFFMENSALSTHNIQTEVDRYISWPGQALAYKMGELKILELREKAQQELGEDFDIRAFHDAVLANGSIPLGILEQKINVFFERKKAKGE